MSINVSSSSIIHPILFALFPVVFIFGNNTSFLSSTELFEPIILILGIATLIWFILKITVKNSTKTSLALSLGIVIFFFYGHFHNSLNELSGEYIRNIVLIPIFLILFSILVFILARTHSDLKNITKIVNAIAITIVIMSSVNIVMGLSSDSESQEFLTLDSSENLNSKNFGTPDVYYIILDSYAGHESLKKHYDFDNSIFLNELRERGFIVIDNSRSNYGWSYLSLGSSLNMMHHNFDPELGSKNYNLAYDMISKNIVGDIFNELGYDTINFNSGWGSTRNFENYDKTICKNTTLSDSQTLISILDNSIIQPVYSKFLIDDKRDRILCQFEELGEITQKTENPSFIFNHFMIPHKPFIFGPNGEFVTPVSLEPGQVETSFRNYAYIDQLQFANKKILESIDEILLNSDTSPIIILQSDHGSEFPDSASMENKIKEKMANFNSYYLPYGGEEILYDEITPVNSFRVIFNYYFDGDYEILEDSSYWSLFNPFETNDKPYFEDVTELLANSDSNN